MGSVVRRFGISLVAIAYLALPALAAPVPLPNAKYEQPTIVMQAQNGQKLLDSFRGYLKLNGASKEVLEKVEASIKDVLGEKGFAGVDLAKPIGGYSYLRAKAETSSFVVVVPITTEKDALEFLGRLRVEAKEESKPKGVYELRGGPFDGVPKAYLRFHDKHAYISVNAESDTLADPEKLVPISRLVDDKETAIAAATVTGKRLPKELTDQAYPLFDEMNKEVDRMLVRAAADMPKNFPPFLKEMLGWGRRSYDLMVSDGDTLTGRLIFDAKTGNLELEATLVPAAKRPLAADLITYKPAKGRFQQLVTPDAVAGGWIVLPGPIPRGVRNSFGSFWAEWIPMLGKETALPPELGAMYEAFGQIAQKAITAGELDLGGAITGPTKEGHYTAIAALGLDDVTPFVKLVLAVGKDLPKEFAEAIKLNAYKIGDVAVHTVALEKLLPEAVRKVFGEKAALNIAVGNKGLFLAVGPNAKSELKRAMALKPAETRAFDTLANMAKGRDLILAGGGNLGNLQGIPVSERLISFYALDVRGGSDFKVRTSLAQLSFWMMFAFAGAR
jgi:hypothetical protein